jgi:hypothetical protein
MSCALHTQGSAMSARPSLALKSRSHLRALGARARAPARCPRTHQPHVRTSRARASRCPPWGRGARGPETISKTAAWSPNQARHARRARRGALGAPAAARSARPPRRAQRARRSALGARRARGCGARTATPVVRGASDPASPPLPRNEWLNRVQARGTGVGWSGASRRACARPLPTGGPRRVSFSAAAQGRLETSAMGSGLEETVDLRQSQSSSPNRASPARRLRAPPAAPAAARAAAR